MEMKKLKVMHESEDDFTFEALLDENILDSIPTIPVYVGRIVDRKKTSEIIVVLNRAHPIERLQHLKRINKDRVLLCLKEDRTETEVKNIFSELNFDLNLLDNLECRSVPSKPPKIRKQFDECNKLWPCNFHKVDYLEKLVSGDCFSDEDKRSNSKWMRLAVESGKKSNGSGAVVALGNELIAVGSDMSSEHPVKHAPMVAIDLVARSQGGGVWPLSPLDYHTSIPPSTDVSGPYLCTGYDIFLSIEPCIMCCMALVHSRIRRIFFLNKNIFRGALVSVTKVQSIKALNHHYEVFVAKS